MKISVYLLTTIKKLRYLEISMYRIITNKKRYMDMSYTA